MTSASTAVAHPNIALIKYWGKRDEELILPVTSSLSMTLDIFPTTTTVTLGTASGTDESLLNGAQAAESVHAGVTAFLERVRALAGRREPARVDSVNTVPTGAGLASSASGFAALAVAAAHAYGLDLDPRALSRLARRGSGSASRSLFGGFALWNAGEDDASSYAEPVPAPTIDAAMVVAVLDAGPKPVSSREAMRRTVQTSPFYSAWPAAVAADLAELRAALDRGDLTGVGEVAERNALRMHATMLGAVPPVRYFSGDSVQVLDLVAGLRREGVPAYATMDAGPNVKVLCPRSEAELVAEAIRAGSRASSVLVAGPGPGAYLSDAVTSPRTPAAPAAPTTPGSEAPA